MNLRQSNQTLLTIFCRVSEVETIQAQIDEYTCCIGGCDKLNATCDRSWSSSQLRNITCASYVVRDDGSSALR